MSRLLRRGRAAPMLRTLRDGRRPASAGRTGSARRREARPCSSTRTWPPARRTGWPRHKIAHSDHDNYYPVINDLATLTWLAQLAALEIHVPQWQFGRNGQPRNPDRLVLDLDPGPGVSLAECAEVAALVRGHPARHRARSRPGDQRQQGHPPVRAAGRSQSTERGKRDVARELARALEADHPDSRDQLHEAIGARRQGVHRLEPEQRRQDHGRAVLAAGSGSPDRRRAPHLGGARGQPISTADLHRGARADHRRAATRWRRWPSPRRRPVDGPARHLPQHARSRPRHRSRCPRRAPARRDDERPVVRDPGAPRAPAALRLPAGAGRRAGRAGPCRRRRRPIRRSTTSRCRPRTIRWSTRTFEGTIPAGEYGGGDGARSGTPAPTSCTSGGTARKSSSPCSASRTAGWAASASSP